jgi:hypothetical protein
MGNPEVGGHRLPNTVSMSRRLATNLFGVGFCDRFQRMRGVILDERPTFSPIGVPFKLTEMGN